MLLIFLKFKSVTELELLTQSQQEQKMHLKFFRVFKRFLNIIFIVNGIFWIYCHKSQF